jgi:hypothetical protein
MDWDKRILQPETEVKGTEINCSTFRFSIDFALFHYTKAFSGIHIIWIFKTVNIDETTQHMQSLTKGMEIIFHFISKFLNSCNSEQL